MNLDTLKYIIEIALMLSPIIVGFCAWLHSVYLKLSKIAAELQPNGGSSLRDSINRIEHKMSAMELMQKTYMEIDSQVPMFRTESDGKFIWANRKFLDLTNRTIEEILNSGWETIVDQEEREQVREEWYRSCEQGSHFEFLYTLNNKNKDKVLCKSYGDKKYGYIGYLEKMEN